MTNQRQLTHPVQSQIPAVVINNFKIMYRPHEAYERARKMLTRLYTSVQETPHFLFVHIPDTRKIILVHRLSHDELDNNIGQYIMEELAPHGLMTSESAFGAALVGVVNSTNPHHPADAWGLFSLNTLQRLREQIDNPKICDVKQDFITPFACIYRYLLSQKVGTSLLDVGCACAFWPLIVAEREEGKHDKIVGADNRKEAITLSQNMAMLADIPSVEFVQCDLLTPEFTELGNFDTVTAIHLIEHIPENKLPDALTNLLKVTRRRLLIAVPYEQRAEVAYGHEQVFSREKLEQWGQWCVEQMEGKGKVYCEDVMGGILVVERKYK